MQSRPMMMRRGVGDIKKRGSGEWGVGSRGVEEWGSRVSPSLYNSLAKRGVSLHSLPPLLLYLSWRIVSVTNIKNNPSRKDGDRTEDVNDVEGSSGEEPGVSAEKFNEEAS